MNDLVTEARSWIGTPYLHQAASKGVGCDCLGLIRGLWVHRFGTEPETPPHYSPDWSEPQGQEALWAAALRHLDVASATPMAAGQVLLFRMREAGVAKHLGVLAQTGAAPTFIHAYGRHAVVESPLSAPWARRIVARFTFPKG